MDLFLATLTGALEPLNILVLAAGVMLGIVIGAIPGLTVNMAVALAVPFTLTMGLTQSLFLLLGIYGAGIYGGSVSAILINAPGTPASAATSADGYALAKQGMAGKALKMAIYASVYGGLFSTLVLVVLAPQIAAFALRFGPPEMAALLLFSLTVVGVLSGGSMAKGLFSAALGLGLATIGADPMVGVPRFTFGSFELYDGLAYIPLLIGLFAVAEMFTQAERSFTGTATALMLGGDVDRNRVTRADWKASWFAIVRSGFLGVFIGVLPGLGATIATFLGYAEAKRASKRPERFGKGAIEGVAAAESANNAVTGAAMVPLLALSIPGDSVTAILLGAFLIQGVTPGPLIFQTNPEVPYTVYIGLILSNLMIAAVAWFAIRPMMLVLRIPKTVLYPIILMICVAGSFAIRNSVFDVYVMIGAGIVGYVLQIFAVPVAPLLIAFILGPPFEEALRQALVGSEGSVAVFFTEPIALFFMVLTAIAVWVTARRARRGGMPLEG
ncbi:putative tricarboxylic transport membrane protein [Constrictibacter sp. MBR-5]|jgi:putative tricarboxylic transport membrane protein|uniref:tripartite tricarboxylate transporter permease n=1 Tax=Constrictibacter sp. MBR-5 TaxID=3156467 RepID=UPI003392BD8F